MKVAAIVGEKPAKQSMPANQSMPARQNPPAKQIFTAKQNPPSVMKPNASDSDNLLSTLSSMAVKPIQDIIEREVDKYSSQARAKLAKERKVQPSKVPDLDVAEYLLGMPTANMVKPMADMNTTLRNSLLFMTVAICTTIFLTRRMSK